MFQQYHRSTGLLFSLLLTLFGVSAASAQIDVNGIDDRGVYPGTRTFIVPTAPGFSYHVLLDDNPILPDFTNTVSQANYHELWIHRTNAATREGSSRLVRFIVRAPDRATTEDGLPPWVPYPMIPSTSEEWAGARIDLTLPESYPAGLEIPVIAWVRDGQGRVVRGNGQLTSTGHPAITLRRGVGSGYLAANHPPGVLVYTARLPGLQSSQTVTIEANTSWTPASGAITTDTVWPADSRIHVSADLTVAPGVTLTVRDGVVVRLASGINITNHGRIVISGSIDRPVVFTPVSRAQPWGGFYLLTPDSLLQAANTIFIASGSRQTGVPGHRNEQALFYLDNLARVALTNCSSIDLAGQFHHSIDRGQPYASLTAVGSLIQRCTTAGEFNGCSLTFLNGALLEVPYEDPFYCADPDCDHDGFYLNTGVHEVRDSLVGWLKDDGLDAGSGGGPSSVIVSNCWIEATYHEALAWSERGRITRTLDTVSINNGQGIEAGWTRGAPTDPPTTPISPDCFAERLFSTCNASGARFGDNYNWGYRGFLRITNSLLLHNVRNIFGKTWNLPGQSWDTNSWVDRLTQMDLRGNFLSAADPNHPNNSVFNPAADAWRIAHFMTTPPGAKVGIGLASWNSTIPTASIFDGVPVRLSCFTTNVVSANYAFVSTAGALTTGTLTFQPGETLKRIFPSGFNLATQTGLRLILSNATQGELTGPTEVTFQGSVPEPRVACAVLGTQIDLARLEPGIPVGLSTRSALEVRVNYQLTSSAGTLASGTLLFAPGQTLLLAPAPGVSFLDHDFLRFTLSSPINAQLVQPTTVYLVKSTAPPPPPSTTLIPRGAIWKYDARAVDLGTAWRGLTFIDDTWSSGPTELGFGEGDQTLIPDNNQITTYFRHGLTVANPAVYTNLAMWMLRDDGGVVYINGVEVFRSPNLPQLPTQILYGTITLAPNGENTVDTTNVPPARLRTGANVVAVEIHQQAPESSDVSFNFELIGQASAPPPPAPPIYLAQFDDQPSIAWGDPQFILEQADQLDGLWSTASTQSPFFIVPSGAQKFYRLIRR